MRLVNTKTKQLKNFSQHGPEFAILSHTWGEEEVLFEDLVSGIARTRKGWSKIERCCERALADGFEYVWIDTCCIQKTNSAELSEAINSMMEWYERSSVCYVYLSDVSPQNPFWMGVLGAKSGYDPYFKNSRWFRRGWTLQELLAPQFVLFLNKEWREIGTRSSLAAQIADATGIEVQYLESFKECNIATKMSWAANRRTTRVEDAAYSLLGLFGINMPPMYGEGRRAFVRLQHELVKSLDDESIFAWHSRGKQSRLYFA